MKKKLRNILFGILGCLVVLVIVAMNLALPTLTSYSAKIMCSCVFLSERSPQDVAQTDLGSYAFVNTSVDTEAKTVKSNVLGLFSRSAIYREGLGCTLLSGTSEDELQAQLTNYSQKNISIQPDVAWPKGEAMDQTWPDGVDREKLQNAIDWAFEDGPNGPTGTRAVLVTQDSLLLGERYAEGFSKDTRLTGWSMTKSITQALVGILVKDGKMDIKQTGLFPEWQDERKDISLDQMLRMSSGLKFNEFYFGPTDATRMLFLRPGAGKYAKKLPAEHEPDAHWSYSSGTTNMISELIREQVPEKQYWNFPYERLFHPIGMHTAVMEPDPSGTFVGSSFLYATARDWARFGLLYLWEGNWYGEQILPEGWAEYARTPTPPAPKGIYGAQFWLNAGEKDNPENRRWPSVPAELYQASGFEGQYVFILPSYHLVIVRLGFTPNRSAFSEEQFIANILEAFPTP